MGFESAARREGDRKTSLVSLSLQGAWAVVGVAAACLLSPHLTERWFREGSYFEHGPAVAMGATLWAIWIIHTKWSRKLKTTEQAQAAPSPGMAMLPGLLGGLAFWIFAARGVGFVGLIGLSLALMAWLLATAGWSGLKSLAGPVGLLCFAFPWPLKLVEDVSLPLKQVALQGAMLLAPDGVVRVGDGAILDLGEQGVMVVGDVCSGLRGLVAMLALAWVIASLARTGWRGCVVLLCSVPLTLACNVVRIALLIFIAKHSSAANAGPESWIHDAVGIGVWILALGGLWLLLRLCGGLRRGHDKLLLEPNLSAVEHMKAWAVWGCVAAPFCVALIAFSEPKHQHRLASELFDMMPRELAEPGVSNGIKVRSRDVPLDPRSLELLKPEASLSRLYGKAGTYHLVMVVGRGGKTRLHPPELCYRGSGFEVISKHRLLLAEERFDPLSEVVALRMRRGKELRLTWYWYQSGEEWTASYASFFWTGLWNPTATQGLNWLSIPVEAKTDGALNASPGDWAMAERRLRWLLGELAPFLDRARRKAAHP